LNLRPLGYEQFDVRLCRLGLSPVVTTTSAYGLLPVSVGLARLRRLGVSRGVSFTNSYTNTGAGLRLLIRRLSALTGLAVRRSCLRLGSILLTMEAEEDGALRRLRCQCAGLI